MGKQDYSALSVFKTKFMTLLIALLLILQTTMPLFVLSSPETELPPANLRGWFDEIVFFRVEDPAKVVDMLEKGDVDVYFRDIGDPVLFKRIRASPDLTYEFSYGLYYEITFNPVGPETLDGKFNPFYNPKIREALNMAIDRQYIVDEIMGGLGIPKFVPVCNGFPDYERHKTIISQLEAKYAYNFEKAREIIYNEMIKEPNIEFKDGKWYYKGEQIVLKFLIRVEDARRRIGDYVAEQLEKLGFTVERMYKTSREASPIWVRGDPAKGEWHLYTGGWVTTAVSRDDSDNFEFFYTNKSTMASISPLWASYKALPELQEVASILAEKKFTTFEERTALMERAFELALQDSVRIWLVDQTAVWVRRREIEAVGDYSAGYWWSPQLYFMNRQRKEGGILRIASSDVLVDPWNPVAGSNWIYDGMISSPTGVGVFILHPKTGLPIPIAFLKKVTLEVEEGTLTFQNPESKDWLTLRFVDKVTIPPDAWYAWDVGAKKIITAGEAGVTAAKVKIVAEFDDILGKVKYHDGTVMSLADFIVNWPLNFERADNRSPLYDESYVEPYTTFRELFRAFRIVSEKPLILEWYVNYTTLDAELIASAYVGVPAMPWHVVAIGIRAEENGLLAFGSDKASKKNVEWMNYIAGPSLEVLSKTLDDALSEGYIPFKELGSRYVTVEEAKARYAALKKWFSIFGHFWVQNGPYYLFKADPVAKTATLRSVRTRVLAIKAEGAGSVNPSPGLYVHYVNEAVTITATPGLFNILEKWIVDGTEVPAQPTLNVIMDDHHIVVAVFRFYYEIVIIVVIAAVAAAIYLVRRRVKQKKGKETIVK